MSGAGIGPPAGPAGAIPLAQVRDIVRALAAEVGGDRAAHAVSPDASLEREVGLGSLERVELLVRLESAFARSLDDRFLELDTVRELAEALAGAGVSAGHDAEGRAPTLAAGRAVDDAATVHEALRRQAERAPERPHVFLREDDGREQVVTYGALFAGASAVASGLAERGVRRGEVVALMLPTGLDFLRCFTGVLAAGAVPVPIYPPVRLDRLEEYAERQAGILRDAGARILVTAARARPIASLLETRVPSLARVVVPEELESAGTGGAAWSGRGEEAAFVQYTSGSTGEPKGVLLTHANLLANIRAIGAGLAVRPTDVGASWLPLYHDMGLIGSWLFCLVQGLPIALQSPLSFLSRPERWLWSIHKHRATLSGAPNFAYELCARRIPDSALEGLDLSSWRCALNGAEPISPSTLERFARRFAPCGFRSQALMPVYGLAECSVALSFPPPERGPRVARVRRGPFTQEGRAVAAPDDDPEALAFVSEGRALPEHDLRIVDEAGAAVPEGVVGRLVFRGPSRTPGYYRKPEATAAVSLEGGFLDSGDLAFVLGGEVHVCGRRKDLIIKGGRNLVPQEIEEVAAGVEGIRRGCVAAVGVPRETLGTESLVVIAETRATDPARREALARAVVESVAGAIGLPPDDVCLVPPGAVPKTSSGKIRRAAARDLYLAGSLGRARRLGLRSRLRLLGAAVASRVAPRATTAARALYTAYVGAVGAVLLLTLWPLAVLLPDRAWTRGVGRFGARLLLLLSGVRVRVTGTEHLARGGPFVLACNHASYTDVPLLMAACPVGFAFVAKKEVVGWPLVGRFVRCAGHLPVERFEAREGVADASRIAQALRGGDCVLFFPEGTFTAARGLRPFRLGAFKLAVETGVPVVPLALSGTRRLLRGEERLLRPGPVELWIGPPLSAQGDSFRAAVALRDRVAEAIGQHAGEMVLRHVVAGPERA